MAEIRPDDKAVLMLAFARLEPKALSIALGSVLGLMLFLATVALLLKSPTTGGAVGPHLALLGIYLPGYEVSWTGALLGFGYFWFLGAALGFVLAALWNTTHYLFVVTALMRTLWWKFMA
jgi:hypothetical protein